MSDTTERIVAGIVLVIATSIYRKIRQWHLKRFSEKRDLKTLDQEQIDELDFSGLDCFSYGKTIRVIEKEIETLTDPLKVWIIERQLNRYNGETVLMLASKHLSLPKFSIKPYVPVISWLNRKKIRFSRYPELWKKYEITSEESEIVKNVFTIQFVEFLMEKDQKTFCFEAYRDRIVLYKKEQRFKINQIMPFIHELNTAFNLLRGYK